MRGVHGWHKESERLTIWLRRSMRFSGTWPVRYMLHPMMGIKKLLVLEMNCAGGRHACETERMQEPHRRLRALNGRRRWNKE